MRVLNLGCGSRPLEGAVNVDAVKQDGVDVVHDLDVFPWPFGGGEAGKIIAFDVYEHVVNWRGFMAECHRILETGGILYIHTAYYRNALSFRDPDHKRYLTEDSFNYWIPGTELYERYGKAYGGHDSPFALVRGWLDTPAGDLNFELRKIDAGAGG